MQSNIQQVVKAATKANKVVEVTAFHKSLFTEIEKGRKASTSMIDKMKALLKSKYGETMPTYEQARGDRQALKVLAEQKGLVDDQWTRKPYNLAVKALYNALPESNSAAAQAKRKLREQGINVRQIKAGAKKGETAPRRTSDPETLEQYIARVGVFKVLEQCVLILEADDSTKGQAAALRRDMKAA